MAGIGFELQKLVKRGSYFSYFAAFLYGTILSSGPWLTTTASLVVLGIYSTLTLHLGTARLLTIAIIYAYAFSLILSGAWQSVLTRYVADKVFERRTQEILPGLRTASTLTIALTLVVGIPPIALAKFLVPVDNPLMFRIAAVLLLAVLAQLWILMSYVSTSKTYRHVFFSFVFGCAISLILSILALHREAVSWALLGYTAGQAGIVLSLYLIGRHEYDGEGWWRKEYLAKIRQYGTVALSGLFYNTGVWADKIVIWFSVGTLQGATIFRSYSAYDVPAFLAFLSMVPALSWFLIIGETTFYVPYRTFVRSLLKEPLIRIEQARRDLYDAARQAVTGMAKFQGVFTLAAVILAVPLLRAIGYGWVSPRLFRLLLLGAYANVLLLNVMILMHYLELRAEAAHSSLVFCVLNTVLTLISVNFGESYLGWSYMVSAGVGLAYAWFSLVSRFEQIDYYLYTRQVPV